MDLRDSKYQVEVKVLLHLLPENLNLNTRPDEPRQGCPVSEDGTGGRARGQGSGRNNSKRLRRYQQGPATSNRDG